jgi:hypothetical protein
MFIKFSCPSKFMLFYLSLVHGPTNHRTEWFVPLRTLFEPARPRDASAQIDTEYKRTVQVANLSCPRGDAYQARETDLISIQVEYIFCFYLPEVSDVPSEERSVR